MKSIVKLKDGTVGTIETRTAQQLVEMLDRYVVVTLHNENGIPEQVAGYMDEIIA